jgi:hypothetical protein
MELDHQGEAVVRHAFDAIDVVHDVDLPERARHIHRQRTDAGEFMVQLPGRAWLRQRVMEQVEAQVHIDAIGEPGVIDIQG